MEAYIAYVGVLVLAAFVCTLEFEEQRKASICLVFFMMLMCGLRGHDVGVDTPNYVRYAVESDVDDYKFGPIYLVLKSISEMFGDDGSVFLLMMALLTYIPLIYIVSEKSPCPGLTVLMYIIPVAIFFNESFNIARQSIGIMYILLASIMIEERKTIQSIPLIILAFFFHPYTIIFAFFFFFFKIILTEKIVMISLGVSIIIGLVGSLSGIQSFLNLLMIYTMDSSSDLVTKFAKYADYDIEANFSLVGQLSHMLPLSALCFIGINKFTLENTFYKMMFYGCILTNVTVSVIFCERIASTYTIAQILAVPYIYYYQSELKRNLLVSLLVATALLYVYNLEQYSHDTELWIPYHTIFN